MQICQKLNPNNMWTTFKIARYLSYQTQISSKYINCTKVLNNTCRNFHYSSRLYRKMFLEHENKYAYDVMKSKGYVVNFPAVTKNNLIFNEEIFDKVLQEDWSKKTFLQLIETFSVLGSFSSENNLCISNKRFDSFIDTLTDSLSQASDEELRLVFHYLLKWPETESIRTRNFIEVWVALDDECLNRMKRWSFDHMLSFVALFYMLNVTRVSDFSLKCLQKMASKAKQLTPNQLVQTMFFVGIMRKSPFDVHNLEVQISKLFREFTIDELAIISMGFFKSKTPIRDMEIISRIISKMIEIPKDIHEVSLAALLKIIRYSMRVTSDDKIYNLLDVLQHEIPRLSLMCNVHLALLGTATLTLHENCLSSIASSSICNMNKARLKDLERLVLTYGTFNFIPDTKECYFQKVINELRNPERLPEIQKHGRSFASCVTYLGHLGIYPTDLMNKILSPEFLLNTYGKQCMSYGREILVIHNSAKIFCPEVSLHYLSDKYCELLAKKYTDYVPNEEYPKQYNVSERMMLDVMRILRECRGGAEFVTGDHIVTHHQRGGNVRHINK